MPIVMRNARATLVRAALTLVFWMRLTAAPIAMKTAQFYRAATSGSGLFTRVDFGLPSDGVFESAFANLGKRRR